MRQRIIPVIVAPIIVAGFLLACAGCNFQTTSQQPQHGVAVLDLDDIARRLGRNVQMQKQVSEKEASLNSELMSLQSFYRRDIEEFQKTIGENPTPQQTQMLREKMDRMNTELKKSKAKSQQELNQLSATLISRFREEVLPVARSVAAEAGMDVVVTKNDTVVFAVSPQADITDRVVEKMLAANRTQQIRSAPPAGAVPPAGTVLPAAAPAVSMNQQPAVQQAAFQQSVP